MKLRHASVLLVLLAACWHAAIGQAKDSPPIRLHPENPRLFEFRGKPLVLITATEHYGAVMNRPFDFERYLADAADKHMTLTRLFVLYRELQTAINPHSTCKPESTDYVAPYPRTGPGFAGDRLPKYDLDRWNPEYFERLHRFLNAASRRGVIVEVTLFSNTYTPDVWALNPLHPANNINGTETIQPAEYLSMRHPRLFARQQALARKIVSECNRYDNVILEICNEPSSKLQPAPPAGTATNPDGPEMDRWQTEIARLIRAEEEALPNRHLISGQTAYTAPAILSTEGLSLTGAFRTLPVDVVNVHTFFNTTFMGKAFDIGDFMNGQTRLQGLRDLFLATKDERKPLNLDEDNAASRFTDEAGWTVHRKRAWTTVLSGGHYDMIDFTIQNRLETGTPEAQRCIRSWMKHLSEFVHSLDLIRARPMPEMVKRAPDSVVASVLAVEGKDYAIYLADAREATDKESGGEIRSELNVELPAGKWRITFLDPVTGKASGSAVADGGLATISLPPFHHDLALRIQKP